MRTTLLILALGAVSLSAQKLVPAPIELPKPGSEGTPSNLSLPNLEKLSPKPRAPFLVPEGVTNVAQGKPVTSSEKEPIVGDFNIVTDGDTEQVEGNAVELGPGVQWVAIDLGAPHEIYGILLWHYFQPRVYFSVVVQTADDAKFTQSLQTWFNNDSDNKAGQGAGKNLNYIETYEGKLVDAKGVKARYVRTYSKGSSESALNEYTDVEVYGRQAP